jgi:hypothetical protein
MQQFLAQKNIPVITQPPTSPDLAPSNFSLFPTLKMGLVVTRFDAVKDMKANAMVELRKITK